MKTINLSSLLLTFLILGCQAGSGSASKIMHWQRTELGFGFGMKDGSEITEVQWQKFVETEMAPRFPAGLSIFDTHGQWQGPDGKIVRETSRIVVIYHPVTEENEQKIEAIRENYLRQFQQDAVMRVDEAVNVRF